MATLAEYEQAILASDVGRRAGIDTSELIGILNMYAVLSGAPWHGDQGVGALSVCSCDECLAKRPPFKKEMYLASGGSVCPYCSSTQIHRDGLSGGTGYVWHFMYCRHCGHKWKDIFTLTGVEQTT